MKSVAIDPLWLFWDITSDDDSQPCFVEAETGASVTTGALKRRVLGFAHHLRGLGVGQGSRVTIHLYNSIDAVVAQLASHYLGAVTCFVDALVQPKALAYYIRATECRVLLTHAGAAGIEPECLSATQVIAAADIGRLCDEEAATGEPHTFAPDEPAYVYFTSGTTSTPKGVVLSVGNHASFVRICDRYWQPVGRSSRHLGFVPFSHGFGTIFLVPLALRTGSQLVIMRAFHPQRVLDALDRYAITHLYGVPSHYQQLLRMGAAGSALKNLRMAFCAAAKLEHSLMIEWERHTGVVLCEGYGLIETCCGTTWRVGTASLGTGHMGPCPDPALVEIGILDENDSLLPAGAIGQIAVRGPSVMKGYLNDQAATDRAMTNGWFKTGDQGYVSADNQLFMTGRIKDIINIAGIKVSPYEVEAVLDEHPAVLQSAVVPAQDALYGEVVKAFVRVRPGLTLTERELIRFASQKLINFQVPKSVEFVETFPVNTMGKLDRKRLASR